MTQGREFLELLQKICWVDGGPTNTYRRITFVFTPRVHQVKVYRIEQVPGYQELPVTEELCKSLTTWMKHYHYTEVGLTSAVVPRVLGSCHHPMDIERSLKTM